MMEKLRKALYYQQSAHMDCGQRAQARERELFAAFDTLTEGTVGVLTPAAFEHAALRIMPELKPEQLKVRAGSSEGLKRQGCGGCVRRAVVGVRA
jgi:hypothetical protein